MKKSFKNIAIGGAMIVGLIAPSIAIAAEVPAVPNTTAALNSGVTTEPMKVVKVKASKKTPAKKATAKRVSKKTPVKKTIKKRARRSLVRK